MVLLADFPDSSSILTITAVITILDMSGMWILKLICRPQCALYHFHEACYYTYVWSKDRYNWCLMKRPNHNKVLKQTMDLKSRSLVFIFSLKAVLHYGKLLVSFILSFRTISFFHMTIRKHLRLSKRSEGKRVFKTSVTWSYPFRILRFFYVYLFKTVPYLVYNHESSIIRRIQKNESCSLILCIENY